MNTRIKLIISGKGLMLRSKKFHGCFRLLKGTMSPQFSISPVRTDSLKSGFQSCINSQCIWILHCLNWHEHRMRYCVKVMVFHPFFSSKNLIKFFSLLCCTDFDSNVFNLQHESLQCEFSDWLKTSVLFRSIFYPKATLTKPPKPLRFIV